MRLTFLVLSFYGMCSISSFVLQDGITNSSVKLELSFQDLLRLVEGDGNSHGQASLNASIYTEIVDLKNALKYLIGDAKKAKGNREHLQNMYTDLKLEFAGMVEALENVTRKYDKVLEENAFLTEVTRNLTEECHASRNQRSLPINKMFKNVTDVKGAFAIVGEALENLTRKYDEAIEENSFLEEVNRNLILEYHASRNGTGLIIDQMLKNITDVNGALAQLKQKQGLDVGFAVRFPKNESISIVSPLVFTIVDYNSGDSYNVNTGKFVCRYPGLYLFATTITRNPGIYESYCCIKFNGQSLVYTVGTGRDLTGYLSGTATLVKHLSIGDEVYVSDCHGVDHIYFGSHFCGALIQPDLH